MLGRAAQVALLLCKLLLVSRTGDVERPVEREARYLPEAVAERLQVHECLLRGTHLIRCMHGAVVELVQLELQQRAQERSD